MGISPASRAGRGTTDGARFPRGLSWGQGSPRARPRVQPAGRGLCLGWRFAPWVAGTLTRRFRPAFSLFRVGFRGARGAPRSWVRSLLRCPAGRPGNTRHKPPPNRGAPFRRPGRGRPAPVVRRPTPVRPGRGSSSAPPARPLRSRRRSRQPRRRRWGGQPSTREKPAPGLRPIVSWKGFPAVPRPDFPPPSLRGRGVKRGTPPPSPRTSRFRWCPGGRTRWSGTG